MGMGLIVSKMALHKIQCEKQIQVNKFMAPEKKFYCVRNHFSM